MYLLRKTRVVLIFLAIFSLQGCSGSSSSKDESSANDDGTVTDLDSSLSTQSLDVASIYRGTLVMENDIEMAIVEVIVARDGKAVMQITTGDSVSENSLLHGELSIDTSDTDLYETQLVDAVNEAEVEMSVRVTNSTLMGSLRGGNYTGDLVLNEIDLSNRSVSLAMVSGVYFFRDRSSKLWQMTISNSGELAGVTVVESGNTATDDCSVQGTLSLQDDSLNIYELGFEGGDCFPFNSSMSGLAYTDSIEIANDVLKVAVGGQGTYLNQDWIKR